MELSDGSSSYEALGLDSVGEIGEALTTTD
jgi:hypothetical protein